MPLLSRHSDLREGAPPVRAFTKLDGKPVTDRSQTEKADYIVILDDTLYSPQLSSLLKDNGKIIVNSKKTIENADSYDAESIASQFRLPTVNTVMFGILLAVSGVVSEDEAVSAIKGYMPEKYRSAISAHWQKLSGRCFHETLYQREKGFRI